MTGRGNRSPGIFGAVAEWWRNFRAERARLDELQRYGDDISHIARDVGLSSADLRTIAARRPDAATQLERRLETLDLDRDAVVRTDPRVLRDLERVCSLCGEKRQCERDLARHPEDPVWRSYCPNAPTLDALKDAGAASARAGEA